MQETLMNKINSVMLIDNNEIDNFINRKILENSGIKNILSFNNTITALIHLRNETKKYDLILIDIYFPVLDGFEFIDSFNRSELYKVHGDICFLSATINPEHKKWAFDRKIIFIEKPLSIDKLLALQPP